MSSAPGSLGRPSAVKSARFRERQLLGRAREFGRPLLHAERRAGPHRGLDPRGRSRRRFVRDAELHSPRDRRSNAAPIGMAVDRGLHVPFVCYRRARVDDFSLVFRVGGTVVGSDSAERTGQGSRRDDLPELARKRLDRLDTDRRRLRYRDGVVRYGYSSRQERSAPGSCACRECRLVALCDRQRRPRPFRHFMVPVAAAVLAAMESVLTDLASRYCPLDKALFLGRLGALVAIFAGIALVLVCLARFWIRNRRRGELAYIGACALVVIAIGGAVLILTGLSGCGGATEAGLTWDWPW